jgi:hypothetical protein
LLLVEVFGQSVEIGLVDVVGIAGKQVGEAEQSLLLRVENVRVAPAAWLLQRRNLRVGNALPLTRSGVGPRSIRAAIDN